MSQNVMFICKKEDNDDFCGPRQSPFVNAFGVDFLHLTICAILKNDKMTAWAGRQAGPELNYQSASSQAASLSVDPPS